MVAVRPKITVDQDCKAQSFLAPLITTVTAVVSKLLLAVTTGSADNAPDPGHTDQNVMKFGKF
jgi:hypothetical protein